MAQPAGEVSAARTASQPTGDPPALLATRAVHFEDDGRVVDVEMADDYACARFESGRVACWGGDAGATPRIIDGVASAQRLVVAGSPPRGCAITQRGAARCWTDDSSVATVRSRGVRDLAFLESLGLCLLTGSAVLCRDSPHARFERVTQIRGALSLRWGPSTYVDADELVGWIDSTLWLVRSDRSVATLPDGFPVDPPPGWRDLGRWLVTTNEGAVFFATESGWERLPLPPVSLVAGGSVSGCAMLTDGETRCWDTERFLYREGQRVMDELLGLSDITAGSGGCGIDAWGRVVCWSQSVLESEPRAVAGVSDAIALTAWSGGTCALTETGEVLCWGRSPQGGREDDSSPTRIARVEGANQLSSGGEPPIVCATTGDGVTRCFGPGGEPPGASGFTFDGDSGGACGRAGDGGIVCGSEEGWTAQADAHEVVELAGNEFDLCWRDRSGSVQCRASRPPSLAPVDELVAGETHFCARLADATVRCWGECVHGPDALARDDEESPCDPYGASRVPLGLANVRQIGAGTAFSCALVEGAVRCWGDTPWRGELGLDAVTHIAVGPEHLCAISGGEVFCVGSSGFGQLGNGIGGAAPVVMIR